MEKDRKMSNALNEALEAIEKEKGVSKEIILEAIETALLSAYKKNYGHSNNVEVEFDKETGEISIFATKEVVEEVEDGTLEISLADARDKNVYYELGDEIRIEVTPNEFGRIAAQTAKQVITQRVREEERNIIYNEYIEYEDDLMQGIVERIDNRYIYVNLGRIEAVLSQRDQIPNERYYPQDRIKVYISEVEKTTKGPQVFVSRTHPNLIKRLFEQEVPEIYDGVVEIKSIAREAGDRSKLAVHSHNESIDPVGTCVGPRGSRVQAVVNELNGENMDIIEWDEDPVVYITNALKPADVIEVHFIGSGNNCIVVVPDDQLSLAIGKKGQNVRLAARLTGYKIDIKSETDFEDIDIEELQAEAEAQEAHEREEVQNAEEAAKEDIREEEDEVLVDEKDLDEEFYVEGEEILTEDLEDLEEEKYENEAKDDPSKSVLDVDYEEGALSSEQVQEMADLAEDRHQEAREENRTEQKEELLEEREEEELEELDEDNENE